MARSACDVQRVACFVEHPGHGTGDKIAGWFVRCARMRPRRHDLLRGFECIAELGKLLATEGGTDLREELVLLFLDVVAHVLDEHADLRIEPFVGRCHVLELGEHPLHDVVFFQRLENGVLCVLDRFADGRIEHLLLDRRVDGELLNDLRDQLGLRLAGPWTCFLELLEKLLDLAVVLAQQRDRIHAGRLAEVDRSQTCWSRRSEPVPGSSSKLPDSMARRYIRYGACPPSAGSVKTSWIASVPR